MLHNLQIKKCEWVQNAQIRSAIIISLKLISNEEVLVVNFFYHIISYHTPLLKITKLDKRQTHKCINCCINIKHTLYLLILYYT